MKVEIQEIPESIVNQAKEIMATGYYSSEYKRDFVRKILGVCTVCQLVPSYLIINNQDKISVISRYCKEHYVSRFLKEQKIRDKRKKVNKK